MAAPDDALAADDVLAPDDLEREYSPSSRVGGSSAPFVADYVARSAAAADLLGTRIRVLPDGSRLVAGDPTGPVLVFIHGGYWQALSAEHSMYLATGAAANGWSYAAIEYTIAPAGTVAQMVDECREAVGRVVAELRAAGCTGPVVLAGHSAGAHLAAMVALADDRPQTMPPMLRRVVLLSGVFDLRSLVRTSVNDPLHLDVEEAAALSPMLHVAVAEAPMPDVVVTWGDDDTLAFARQSRAYADALLGAGYRATAFEAAQRHHFDIVDDLVDRSTPLGRLVADGL